MSIDERLEMISSFLHTVRSSFKDIKFRCQYNDLSKTYYIEVKPLEQFEQNELYAKMEYDFCNSFEERFADYDVLFVSDGSLCKVTNPILTVGYNELAEIPRIHNMFHFDLGLLNTGVCGGNTNDYALAA